MPLNIVYIDDESGLCEMFEDNFTSKDICVKTFLDPEKALLAIANDPPDLVFLDFRLPGTTGDVVVTKIDRSIPVAMISGDLNVKPNELFVKMFSKPFDFSEMAAFIQSYSDLRKAG